MQDGIFSGLLIDLEDGFQEMDSNITTALRDSDERYYALQTRLSELEKKFPFIESVMDGTGAVRLTAEEHAGLVEYIRITDEAENRERLNLYLVGHRDCFAYLKKIGII